jgi:hypothetical protein
MVMNKITISALLISLSLCAMEKKDLTKMSPIHSPKKNRFSRENQDSGHIPQDYLDDDKEETKGIYHSLFNFLLQLPENYLPNNNSENPDTLDENPKN